VGRHVRYRREAVEAWLERRADERFLGAQYDSPEPGQAAAKMEAFSVVGKVHRVGCSRNGSTPRWAKRIDPGPPVRTRLRGSAFAIGKPLRRGVGVVPRG
jgi:hypothetical protein